MSLPTYVITSGAMGYQGTHPEASEPVKTPAWRWNQPATRDVLVWHVKDPMQIKGHRNLVSHLQRITDRPDEWPTGTISIHRIAS